MTKTGLSRPALRRAGAGAVILATTGAGLALAAKPVAGASYSGSYKGSKGSELTFTVSANGKRVTHVAADTPVKCPGTDGVGGLPYGSNGAGPISKAGTFRVTMKLLDQGPPGKQKTGGTEVVTGTFQSHGRAQGKVTAHLFQNGVCHGITVSYSARRVAAG